MGETGVEARGGTRRTAVVQDGRGTGGVRGTNKYSSTDEEDITSRGGGERGGERSADIPDDRRRTCSVCARFSDKRWGCRRR